ncbi:glycerophosphodiester phosphodiesterase [uncultured Salinisphaera sp.]|uniref:glycerophosphodiester phosphodiesterase n=1 Tax=uncultured Salinisphaera sp. TaxID=359372 RepID=UPI0032B228AF|tara:strand:- start:679 stop:1617 length:939 start_codon:yes stop_codon:yes gene_type:complete
MFRQAEKIVIAHRGASGYVPEHTLAGYAMAYALGADFIEPDVVMTADSELICLHDIHLDTTTDVAERYPDRARADGRWYAADFTWDEVSRLAARERVGPDGQRVFEQRFKAEAQGFGVPRLASLIELVQSLNRQTGRFVGIYPETKAPAFHDAEGLALEAQLLGQLADYGYHGRQARIFIQSFAADNLAKMRFKMGTQLPMIQLIASDDDAMVSAAGLDEIATYADGIGPDKRHVVDSDGALVAAAHARGLLVHPYTFRADQLPAATVSLADELRQFYDGYGVDGVFTDFTDIAVDVLRRLRHAVPMWPAHD